MTSAQIPEFFRFLKFLRTIFLKDDESWFESRYDGGEFQRFPLDVEGDRQGTDLRRGEHDFQMLDAIANRQRDGIAPAHA